MSPVSAAFDRWVARGPFVPLDMARYRVLFAGTCLLGLPDYEWVAAYPDSFYAPPPGPFSIFDGFPPQPFFVAVEILLAISLAALVLGVRIRMASIAAAVLLLVGSGFSYSLGKIDHGIFLVLTPLALVFTSWGWPPDEVRSGRAAPQWPMRLLALLIGAGFLTAAAPKVLAGWLSPQTQALQETAFRQFYVNGRTEMLADRVVHMPYGALWEVGDWSIVVLEALVILAVVDWTAFRAVLALLAIFHLGVYPTMNISFAGNVLVYGAFVPWSRLPLPSRPTGWLRLVSGRTWVTGAGAVLLGSGTWAIEDRLGTLTWLTGPVILVIGGCVGACFLVLTARRALRATSTAPRVLQRG